MTTALRSAYHRILNYRPDLLIMLIAAGVVLALLFPVSGHAAQFAGWVTKAAVALLFFLYGARLSPREALQGLAHWRLHLLIFAFTFLVFPLLGLALMPLKAITGEGLYLGILFTTLVPSTVQSSVAFTSIARGNVAASIVAASASSLLGVVLTPLLVLALMSTGEGLHIDGHTFIDIGLQLLLPFALGQVARAVPGVVAFASSPVTKNVDKISIGLVVYVSFSEGVVEGVWHQVSWVMLFALILGSIAVVYAMLWLTSFTATKLGFGYRDQVAIQFAGTKKSLAAGLPMAAVMFGGGNLGLLILPLMIFHQVQLVICSMRASKYARDLDENKNHAE
ncbi:bile acid:sodium symporter family protein [Corynebacterium heidelbergense]|uniref:Bile acid:sodium symporter n=1 Tax=Corynebacterium heidelbergense TaxID=2055947 RepID=A0A364VBY3_9CORY|nr:bile acid:sodium symporter family protein [Corynebacterium heidelbergense]RAV34162.1 hypothetical protein CWC39_04735 [Corynebacterium heidelbergense]WCZ37596.1 hypothetical protein CHEID_10395 [Corynebacterium heidelbergense]